SSTYCMSMPDTRSGTGGAMAAAFGDSGDLPQLATIQAQTIIKSNLFIARLRIYRKDTQRLASAGRHTKQITNLVNHAPGSVLGQPATGIWSPLSGARNREQQWQ